MNEQTMSPERLAHLRGLGDDDLPVFWLVQIRDLLAERDRLAQQLEELQANGERWHDQAYQRWIAQVVREECGWSTDEAFGPDCEQAHADNPPEPMQNTSDPAP